MVIHLGGYLHGIQNSNFKIGGICTWWESFKDYLQLFAGISFLIFFPVQDVLYLYCIIFCTRVQPKSIKKKSCYRNPMTAFLIFKFYRFSFLNISCSLNNFSMTVPLTACTSGFFKAFNGPGSWISRGDFPSINFTELSRSSRIS